MMDKTTEVATAEMTPIQEAMNALTAFVWTACTITQGWTFASKATKVITVMRLASIAVSSGLHMPFSFIYHTRQALRLGDDPMDNKWRRLDQAGINIGCILYCFGTSGSIWYGSLALLFKFYHVIEIWRPTSNPDKRRFHIFMGAIMYLLPLWWFQNFKHFFVAFSCLIAGSLGFVLNKTLFFGYGSTVLHLLMIPYHKAILSAIFTQSEGVE